MEKITLPSSDDVANVDDVPALTGDEGDDVPQSSPPATVDLRAQRDRADLEHRQEALRCSYGVRRPPTPDCGRRFHAHLG